MSGSISPGGPEQQQPGRVRQPGAGGQQTGRVRGTDAGGSGAGAGAQDQPGRAPRRPSQKKAFPFRPADLLALLLSLGIVGAAVAYTWGGDGAAQQVLVSTEGADFLYSLDIDGIYPVEGPEGVSYIEVHDHKVRVQSSPCRDQICVHAGWLQHTGQWTACLPNSFLVRVEGSPESADFDATTF